MNDDMKYIVTFTGIEHSMFLIYFFIKNLGFKIDSVSLLHDITKEQLEDVIKNSTDKSFHTYLFPNKLKQCSANTGFTAF